VGAVVDIDAFGIDAQFGVLGHLVGVGDAGEFLDLAFARQLVEALAVAAFAFLQEVATCTSTKAP
jgi:hypothetical protein